MINIFDYSDFRKYLTDWYNAKKQQNPHFSYQLLAEKAGVRNKGFIYNIINGAKVLSKSNIIKLSTALGHTRYEAEYFELLVSFNQATDTVEKRHFFEKLSRVCNVGKPVSEAQLLRADQYEFYSNWYHATVRSIIGMYEFLDDYKWLAKMVNPSITVTQAKHSVRLLEKLGLITKDEHGIYRICASTISTGADVMSVAFQNFHVACTDLARRAFTEFPLEIRNMTGLTLGISERTYETIRGEIGNFQKRIIELVDRDASADRVYHLNFHFFPTSGADAERQKI